MNNLKILLLSLALMITTSYAKDGDRFNDLTYNYFYGQNSNVSLNVRKVIAEDPLSSKKVLKILAFDSDYSVRLLAKNNLINSL
jgi:hypothetical protein